MQSKSADAIAQFQEEVAQTVKSYGNETAWKNLSHEWLTEALAKRYVYNFSSLGRPIIQLPTDMVAFQEIVWDVKPDLIIETGIAHGGSLIFSASMLALLDMCDAIETGTTMDPSKSDRKVLGIDIDIRAHNLEAIKQHPMASRIEMIEGSSIDQDIFAQVQKAAEGYKRVLVCLDSNHTHDHVRSELELYAPLTSVGSYCVVFDTLIEDMPADEYPNRSWGPGNNPKTAVWDYLKSHDEFEIDKSIPAKLLITVAHDGFLKRIR